MAYSPSLYVHDLDKRAFDALNMFPYFVRLHKEFVTNGAEKAARIEYLSTAIRLNEKQKPEIYLLLPPICEKLGIDIPELYIDYSGKKRNQRFYRRKYRPLIYV